MFGASLLRKNIVPFWFSLSWMLWMWTTFLSPTLLLESIWEKNISQTRGRQREWNKVNKLWSGKNLLSNLGWEEMSTGAVRSDQIWWLLVIKFANSIIVSYSVVSCQPSWKYQILVNRETECTTTHRLMFYIRQISSNFPQYIFHISYLGGGQRTI